MFDKFEKVDPKISFPEMERIIIDFWKENSIFEKSLLNREGAEEYVFYEGPPTANGMPHPGHVLTRVIKDIFPRFQTMKGKLVHRKGGWDTHGLPVEIEVEKKLGLESKEQIEEYGVEAFSKKCKESVFTYIDEWERLTERIAFWLDQDEAYVTYKDYYIESVWWCLKQIFDKGLIYKGHKIVPYCTRCGTPLSSHEVAQNYKDVKDPSIYVFFKAKKELGADTYFMAWTTTPWTLISNVALTVDPDFDYAWVKLGDSTVILAAGLVETVFKGMEIEIIKTVKGSQLEGLEYEPLFSYVKPDKPAWRVCLGDFVTLDSGTGIVHTAPAFGEDDYRIGLKNDMPMIQLVEANGTFKSEVTEWAGRYVKDCDNEIIEHLKARKLVFKKEKYEHSYPFCWRCDSPLLYYARESWYIRTTTIKDQLVELNKTIGWYPPSIGENRFGNFLENNIDWALSRDRYWGTPLPVWICEDCGHKHCIGGREELKEHGIDVPDEIELHKPYIDAIKLKCTAEGCSGTMTRTPEVIDCWFDSGAMPIAQHGYPHKEGSVEKFQKAFPADFIAEAVDQTRGWFYTLHAISTLIFDKVSYKNCVVLGLVQGEDGLKMSKSKSNYVSPDVVLDKYGADALRWYFTIVSPVSSPVKFYPEAVFEVQRKMLMTLWNTYSFFTIYANIDKFNPQTDHTSREDRSELDRWLYSRMAHLVSEADRRLTGYDLHHTARAIDAFVDEVSNWYVRRSRSRFWKSARDTDKLSAYTTLYDALMTVAKVAAPFVPFITEHIYRNLTGFGANGHAESVHLCDWPEVHEEDFDNELEREMALAMLISKLGRSARTAAQLKVRQPLAEVVVIAQDEATERAVSAMEQIVLEELNIKKLTVTTKAGEYVDYVVQPNLPVLGPKLGKKTGALMGMLKKADTASIVADMEDKGEVTLNVAGEDITLTSDELLVKITPREGYAAERQEEVAVVLNTQLNDELIAEGHSRELIHHIQELRKEADLDYEARITVQVGCPDKLKATFERFAEQIKGETLATQLNFAAPAGEAREAKIGEETVLVAIQT